MVAKSVEVGALVWAKMKGYPYWPGLVIEPPAAVTPKIKKFHHYVMFYGYNNHAWIPDELILLHNEKSLAKFATQKIKSVFYQEAVDKIVNESKSCSKYSKMYKNNEKHEDTSKYQMHESSFENLTGKNPSPKLHKHESSFEKLSSNEVSFKSSSISKNVPMKKMVEKIAKKHNKHDSSFKKLTSKDAIFKSSGISKNVERKMLMKEMSLKNVGTKHNEHRKHESSFEKLTSKDVTLKSFGIPKNVPKKVPLKKMLKKVASKHPCAKDSDSNCKASKNEILKTKTIQPTSKKIGFLGLGNMGQGIVKNLLQSGHSVTIWQRTTNKCDPFKDLGAKVASTPADVIESSDITFSCVSDSDAAKRLFFGNCGILKGMENCKENKGYVEMTSMDPKTSQAIAEEVKQKKGRYLEAPFTGSRVQAIEGTLFILAAGDRSLYDECETYFQAIANESMYVGAAVGSATQYNIIHTMLVGSVYATLAESLALVIRCGMNGNEFLEILKQGVLNNKEILEKGKVMLNKECTDNALLKHITKNLKLALSLGSSYDQPLLVTATVNEAYKRLKLRCADHDVNAVYEGIKR